MAGVFAMPYSGSCPNVGRLGSTDWLISDDLLAIRGRTILCLLTRVLQTYVGGELSLGTLALEAHRRTER